jgi:hypothetical protein
LKISFPDGTISFIISFFKSIVKFSNRWSGNKLLLEAIAKRITEGFRQLPFVIGFVLNQSVTTVRLSTCTEPAEVCRSLFD